MKAIHAILAAVKAALAITGQKKAEVAVETVDTVATTLEQVLAAVKVHAADGNTVAFISSPDTSYDIFKKYSDVLRDVFAKDTAANGVAMPRVVLLPPGVGLEVVRNAVTAAAAQQAVQDAAKGLAA